jgi:hypothetical protein
MKFVLQCRICVNRCFPRRGNLNTKCCHEMDTHRPGNYELPDIEPKSGYLVDKDIQEQARLATVL